MSGMVAITGLALAGGFVSDSVLGDARLSLSSPKKANMFGEKWSLVIVDSHLLSPFS